MSVTEADTIRGTTPLDTTPLGTMPLGTTSLGTTSLGTTPELVALALPGAAPGDLPGQAQVRWRRSARALRVSLRIDARSASVVVTLPPRAGRRQGLALLSVHAAWVTDRLAALAPHLPLTAGATLLLGGAPHVLRLQPGNAGPQPSGPVWLEPGAIVVAGAAGTLARRTTDFLQGEAQRRIAQSAHGHAAALGVQPRGIRLKDTRSRWGSCAPDGTLAFSWRLVMAPDWVLDYVVAHEVAHLRELNHSVRFWALVAGLTPHRDAAVAWLKAQGPGLLRVG
jgi:predicted metal-dependent hydrolase